VQELTGIGNDFLNSSQKPQQLSEMTDKWDHMKLQTFCTTKEMITKLKRKPTEWEKIFVSYTFDKGLITRIYKRVQKTKLAKYQ
jgi:hypothetical protein